MIEDGQEDNYKKHNIIQRDLIKNATHFQQPVDQHDAQTLKEIATEKYRAAKLVQQQNIEDGKVVSKMNKSETRKLAVKIFSESYEEFLNKHRNVVVKSWRNTGMFLPLSGAQDGVLNEVF